MEIKIFKLYPFLKSAKSKTIKSILILILNPINLDINNNFFRKKSA